MLKTINSHSLWRGMKMFHFFQQCSPKTIGFITKYIEHIDNVTSVLEIDHSILSINKKVLRIEHLTVKPCCSFAWDLKSCLWIKVTLLLTLSVWYLKKLFISFNFTKKKYDQWGSINPGCIYTRCLTTQ